MPPPNYYNPASLAPWNWGNITDPIYAGRPEALWQMARRGQMGGLGFLPQFRRLETQGFDPTYGQFILGGPETEGRTFGEWLAARGAAGAMDPGFRTTGDAIKPGWQAWVNAARYIDQATQQGQTLEGMLEGEGIPAWTDPRVLGYLWGDDLSAADQRQNILAAAGAAMGGGIGIGAQARQRALGSLYDLYAGQALAEGRPVSGFINWINQQGGFGLPETTVQNWTPKALELNSLTPTVDPTTLTPEATNAFANAMTFKGDTVVPTDTVVQNENTFSQNAKNEAARVAAEVAERLKEQKDFATTAQGTGSVTKSGPVWDWQGTLEAMKSGGYGSARDLWASQWDDIWKARQAAGDWDYTTPQDAYSRPAYETFLASPAYWSGVGGVGRQQLYPTSFPMGTTGGSVTMDPPDYESWASWMRGGAPSWTKMLSGFN